MKTIKILLVILVSILINSCATSLQDPIIKRNYQIDEYKYVFIPTTNNVTSSAGAVYGDQYGVYGGYATKSVNPRDVVSGILLKEGFTILPEINPELENQTLVVIYGESGRRNVGFGGYTIEVTITFTSAASHKTICSCTAEGIGQTEADDIRIAINRCLSSLFAK
jgi:hypothetical protein